VSVRRTGTWLGDAADVVRTLGLTAEEDIRRIAPMLGLVYAEEAEAMPEPDTVPGTQPGSSPVSAPAQMSQPRVSRLRALAPLALPVLEPVRTQLPDQLDTLAGAVLPEENENGVPPALPFRPLLRPRTAAGVAAALVRTWGRGFRIDERRAVAALAGGRPVRALPRRPRLSLHRGVQILIDLSEALDPYGRDQQSVVALVQRVVGQQLAPVGSFENCPSRGVWLLPRSAAVRGRPVLVLTDLGLGGPQAQSARASAAEWASYAHRAARAGSPVIALIPYPPDRARGAIRRRIAVVPWDRASVSAVQRARRRVS
jgi:hypothetical protein